MSNLCILLHTKRMTEFCELVTNFCQLLIPFVGYFDVFPKRVSLIPAKPSELVICLEFFPYYSLFYHITFPFSCLPWYEIFYRLLNELAEILNRSEDNHVGQLLSVIYAHEVVPPGQEVDVVTRNLKEVGSLIIS